MTHQRSNLLRDTWIITSPTQLHGSSNNWAQRIALRHKKVKFEHIFNDSGVLIWFFNLSKVHFYNGCFHISKWLVLSSRPATSFMELVPVVRKSSYPSPPEMTSMKFELVSLFDASLIFACRLRGEFPSISTEVRNRACPVWPWEIPRENKFKVSWLKEILYVDLLTCHNRHAFTDVLSKDCQQDASARANPNVILTGQQRGHS